MGVKELIAERKTEWFAEGERNNKIATAKKALECGIAVEMVSLFTGLSVEEVKSLR